MATVLDIGVDLGTASVVIYGKGKDVVLNEPAVIAFDRDSRNVLAVGEEARRMLGRTPSNIAAIRPLQNGMVADMEMACTMLRYFIGKVVGKRLFGGPRILISVPDGVNEMERHRIMTSLFEIGARRTQIMERPIAAAIGAGLAIGDAYGQMIVDIGGGVTDIAVLSQGKIIASNKDATNKIGGDAFDDAVIRYVRRKHNLLLGELTAEDLKISIGSAQRTVLYGGGWAQPDFRPAQGDAHHQRRNLRGAGRSPARPAGSHPGRAGKDSGRAAGRYF